MWDTAHFQVAREGLKGLDPDVGEKRLSSLLSPPIPDLHTDICCLCGAHLGLDYTLRCFSKGQNHARDTRITPPPLAFVSKGAFQSARWRMNTGSDRPKAVWRQTEHLPPWPRHSEGTKPLEAPSLGRKLAI